MYISILNQVLREMFSGFPVCWYHTTDIVRDRPPLQRIYYSSLFEQRIFGLSVTRDMVLLLKTQHFKNLR